MKKFLQIYLLDNQPLASKMTNFIKNIFLLDLYGKKESPNFASSNTESWQSGRLRQS
jgi:hypothetical protein